MNITFDKVFKQRFWQMVDRQLEHKTCPFCGVEVRARNFAGAAFVDGELRAFDGSLPCLIDLSRHIKEEDL